MSRWVRWKYPRVLGQMKNIEEDPDVQKLAYLSVKKSTKKK
jgi:hypothetical protein